LAALERSRAEHVHGLVQGNAVTSASGKQAAVNVGVVELDRVNRSKAEHFGGEGHRTGHAETVIAVAGNDRAFEEVVAETLGRGSLGAEAEGREGGDRYKFAHA